MKTSKILVGALAVSLAAASAFAHGGATGVVKERMDAMGALKDAMKALSPMMQGKTPYDADFVGQQAAIIGKHAGTDLTELFPEGTLDKPSEARPEIWESWSDFERLAEELATLSEGLALASKNGLMMAGNSSTGMMGSGNHAMMGNQGGMMMQGGMAKTPSLEELSKMPADGVFMMLSQSCSACHTLYRVEK
jgi:cytochrome c556